MSTATRTTKTKPPTACSPGSTLDRRAVGGGRAPPFWGRIVREGWDREAYRRTMSQIFHYTRHNSVNQAAAAFRADPDDLALLRFIYGHAKEESVTSAWRCTISGRSGLVGEGGTSIRRCPPPTRS